MTDEFDKELAILWEKCVDKLFDKQLRQIQTFKKKQFFLPDN